MSTPSPLPLRAEILAIGSELLTPFRTDSNSLFITARLNDLGISVVGKAVVGDRRDDLARALRLSLERADLVVLTGGLGPTDDDVTREAVAEALGLPLDEDPAIIERLRARFAARGLEMPEINRRQAQVLRGAAVLPNPNGTAPGQWVEHEGRVIVLLPGPPREMRPMLETVVAERLEPVAAGARIYRRVVKIAGRTESHVEQIAQPVYAAWQQWTPPVATSILASPGQIELHLSVRAETQQQGEGALERAVHDVLAVLGSDVYSTDGRALEQVVGDLLRGCGWRVATAESCTGGLVCSRLTDVPGSSDYVDRGFVCYSNQAKTEWLGVAEEMIREHGAVSEPVGVAMAAGARQRAGVDLGVGITGVAGPGGGSAEKPVGTVVVAVAWEGGHTVERFRFPGGREQVKFQASQAALTMMRRVLEGRTAGRRTGEEPR